MKQNNKRFYILTSVIILFLLLTGCMRYLTQNREEVLLDGIDIDQTLKVAALKMEERQGKWGTALPLWVIRDQNITPSQALECSRLYFQYIGALQKKFDIWHLTWAIADMYRLGDDSVKAVLDSAYIDASKRAEQLEGVADKMANGDKLFMGDAHSGGRTFAKKHVVVPGRNGYLQSYEEYVTKHAK